MLRLYGSGRSRWVRPLWMLRELEVPFEAITVDRAGGELDSPAFRALNPTGKIPVLVDEGRPIRESGAILLYLGDKFAERGLLPPAGTYPRGVHDQWMFAIATEIEQPLWRMHKQLTRGVGDEAVATQARRDFFAAAVPFEEILGRQPFLLGDRFLAADIMLAHLLCWGVAQDLLASLPGLRGYRDRTVSRPAFPADLYAGTPFVRAR